MEAQRQQHVGKRVRATWVSLLVAAATLTACGGGSDGDSSNRLASSSQYAQQCAPTNSLASTHTGSLDIEKQWVRAYLNDAYLWYDEVPAITPGLAQYSNTSDVYGSLDNYFQALKTIRLTASGARKDKFSFILPTSTSDAIFDSGVEAGNGINWRMLSPTKPRGLRVAYVTPGTEAATKGVLRGDTLVTVDGVSADDDTSAGVDVLNAGLFPSDAGGTHTFVFTRAGVGQVSVSLTTVAVTTKPVLNYSVVPTATGNVGTIVFNSHVAPAEAQLIEAVSSLKAQGVTDLVLDLRYNGGGYLYIASELAYMIAGPARTAGKTFEKLNYNAKRTSDNAQAPFGFQATSTTNAALPTLDLSRVYVLTTSETCSASEAVINGLRGVDLDVRQIGGGTCGKPYGFAAQDNCGISYFPIEFQGVNAKGFGDYADGFVPNGSGATGIAGCAASDDLSQPLGSPDEGLLKAALAYRATGACPALSAAQESAQSLGVLGNRGAAVRGRPLLSNRFLKSSR
jgi:carboxyl-terminal processing protease